MLPDMLPTSKSNYYINRIIIIIFYFLLIIFKNEHEHQTHIICSSYKVTNYGLLYPENFFLFFKEKLRPVIYPPN